VAERTFVHPFHQIIPKPFCASGPFDYLKVEGPLDLSHRVTVGDEGEYTAEFSASGVLQVTPIDPRTGATGPTFEARIHERHHSSATDHHIRAEHVVRQYLLADPVQAHFQADARGPARRVRPRRGLRLLNSARAEFETARPPLPAGCLRALAPGVPRAKRSVTKEQARRVHPGGPA
jgi:hypothetical protein